MAPSSTIGSPTGHLRNLLHEGPPPGWELEAAERVDSTNRWGRRILADREPGTALAPAVLVAWEQTAGRGRQGRSWASPAGCGLYVSFLVPEPSPERLMMLPVSAAVALGRALNALLDGRVRLKWPNDVMIGRRKLAGILVESILAGGEPRAAVVGLGVNYEVPAGAMAADRAYLCEEGVERSSLPRVTRDLVRAVARELTAQGRPRELLAAYRGLCAHAEGEPLRFRSGGEVVDGIFRGFDRRGHLRLESEGEERLLAAGDVVE